MSKKIKEVQQIGSYKLNKVSRKKIEIDEKNFIESYGHLKMNHFLKPDYNFDEGIAIFEPINTLVSFIVKLEG